MNRGFSVVMGLLLIVVSILIILNPAWERSDIQEGFLEEITPELSVEDE